ncbi:MAG: TIGR00730 family Rossman fold protein [Gammaproteobacteria bacterium]
MTGPRNICVYCASSDASDAVYRDAAQRLGGILTARGYAVIYGGGATGSMGALADGVVAADGTITGVMPRFMMELEWAHKNLTELRVVEDMRTRNRMMLSESHGLVTLPGGPGTLEEVPDAFANAPEWPSAAREFARVL